MAACLALPALAVAATSFHLKWSKSAALTDANTGNSLTAVACAPTDTSSASTTVPASTTTTTTPSTTTTATTTRAGRANTTTSATTTGTTTSTTTTETPAATGTTGTLVANKTNLCLAGDSKGGIWASVHPGRGKVSWSRERVNTAHGGVAITAIACPALNLCVALDGNGQLMHSSNPAGGAKYWSHATRIDPATAPGGGYSGFSAISCPSTQLCVATDNAVDGQIAYTTDPAGPASGWKLATIGTGVILDAVSCPTASLCVIGGSVRYYSTDPTGGATAWTEIGSLDGTSSMFSSLSCNTAKLCVGVGYGNAGTGLSASTSTLTTAGGTWTGAYVGNDPPSPATGLVDSVSCPTRNLCVAVDGASNAYTTTTPVRGKWGSSFALKKKSTSTYSAVSCNETLCVEVDNRGTATYGAVKSVSSTPTTTTKTSTTTTTK
jgi:hypothetical protein